MNKSENGLPELFVVPHTHWDREWYAPFQEFRRRLVNLIDDLLAMLDEDPDFSRFTLDGQTIVLEDYLEVRPEMEDRLKKAIAAGRIAVGPWYVLPDENLVSGEAIIRNLERGMAISRRFGRPMMLGYLPDQFGHIASMPEILSGFGVDTACLWRGVGEDVSSPVFLWQGPSGARVTCIYLPLGYGNAVNLPMDPDELRREIDDIVAKLEPWHKACPVRGLPYLLMNGSDHQEAQEGLPAALKRALAGRRTWQIGTLEEYAAIVRSLAGKDASLSAGVLNVHEGELRSPLRAPLLVGVTSVRHWIKQRDWQLSRNLEKYAEPLSALASLTGTEPPNSQAYLELAWKYLLQNQPHDSICGCSVDQVHADMSYRFDQCEIIVRKQVEEAGKALAAQVDRSFAGDRPVIVVYNPGPETDQALVEVSLRGFPPGTNYLEDADGNLYPVQVRAGGSSTVLEEDFSPAQIRFYLRFLRGRKLLNFYVNSARISSLNSGGILLELETGDQLQGDLDIEALEQELLSRMEAQPPGFKVRVRIRTSGDVEAVFHPGLLPSLGVKTFAPARSTSPRQQRTPGTPGAPANGNIPPSGAPNNRTLNPKNALSTPFAHSTEGRLSVSKRHVENEFFRVELAPDGYFVVTDLQTGVVYPAINLFIDGGDRGDEYNWDPPASDKLVSRPVRSLLPFWRPVRVSIEENGPVRATLRVEMIYAVPRALSGDRDSRNRRNVPLKIITRVSLASGIKRIDFKTTVENRALDHRLRVHFRVPFVAEKSYAGCQFAVVERVVGPAAGPGEATRAGQTNTPVEIPIGTHPMRDFVDVSDGTKGLAVSTKGLFEYEVIPGKDSSELAITLMRCVGYLSRPDLRLRPGNAGPEIETPGAQCLGRWDFEYSIYPHAGFWDQARVHAFAQAYQTPPVAFRSEGHGGTPQIPPTAAIFHIDDPNLVWSAVRKTGDGGLHLRFYNISKHPGRAKLFSLFPLREATVVDLAGNPLSAASGLPSAKLVNDNTVEVRYGPCQIITLKVSTARRDGFVPRSGNHSRPITSPVDRPEAPVVQRLIQKNETPSPNPGLFPSTQTKPE
ncbi:MAG: hypothetical protein IMW97_00430 [Firmicutes bacterium]|nr:hypothetical protein [Candidatus Fermentithermobacillaceae bacterium]